MCLVYIVESLKRKCLISETPLSRALRVFLRRIAYWTPPLVLSCLGVPLSGGHGRDFITKLRRHDCFFVQREQNHLFLLPLGLSIRLTNIGPCLLGILKSIESF